MTMQQSDLLRFLPIREYRLLHANPEINYQLNRFLVPGAEAIVAGIGARIRTLPDWPAEFLAAAGDSERQGDLARAAAFYRAALFFMRPADPATREAFDRFIDCFDRSPSASAIERFRAPYAGSGLHGFRMRASEAPARGSVVIFGGFDSHAEEFLALGNAVTVQGYDVVIFDGPGQGTTLMRESLPMTPEWERPVAAILDHFDLSGVNLIGISLGGYLALRAAAFEPRIARVVACDALLDLFDCVAANRGALRGRMLDLALRLRLGAVVDRVVRRIMAHDEFARWAVEHGMHVMGRATPAAFFEASRHYNGRAISREVRQDVFVMAAAEDHLVPHWQFFEQMALLSRARSVTGEILTRQDNAQAHCHVGNLSLAVFRIMRWIEAHDQ